MLRGVEGPRGVQAYIYTRNDSGGKYRSVNHFRLFQGYSGLCSGPTSILTSILGVISGATMSHS